MTELQSNQAYDHDTVKHTFAELLRNISEDAPDAHITTEKHLTVEGGSVGLMLRASRWK